MATENKNMAANPDSQLKEAQSIIEKSVSYVAETQPLLEKYAAFQAKFDKRASEVAGVLIDRGIIPAKESVTLLEKLAADPTLALDLVARLARIIGPDELGKRAEIKIASGAKLDPFEALVINGDSSKTQNESSSLMVD